MTDALSAQPLRIGIDGEALRVPLTGVGHYVFNLCAELEALLPQAQFFAYVARGEPHIRLPSARWQVRVEPSSFWQRLPSVAWLKLRSPRLCARDDLDAYWGCRTFIPRLPRGVRTLSTVHDLNSHLAAATMSWKHRLAHQAWFARDARRADAVMCNSQGTADRLAALLGIGTQALVKPGVAPRFLAANQGQGPLDLAPELVARGVQAPYLLSVATHEPRKNLVRLLDAFEQLQAAGELPGYKLVLVGASGWKNEELDARITRSTAVVRTGYALDDWLPALYARAEALVFPSTYEGFGMPVLEAALCGTRVVTTDIPELREAGGPDATYIEPTVEGIAAGIRAALAAPRRATPPPAQAEHTWPHAARILAEQIVAVAQQTAQQ